MGAFWFSTALAQTFVDITLEGRKMVVTPWKMSCNTATVGGYDLLHLLIVMSPLTELPNVESVLEVKNETKTMHKKRVARGKLFISNSLPEIRDTLTILPLTNVTSLTVEMMDTNSIPLYHISKSWFCVDQEAP